MHVWQSIVSVTQNILIYPLQKSSGHSLQTNLILIGVYVSGVPSLSIPCGPSYFISSLTPLHSTT
jgi:hypothetical protein